MEESKIVKFYEFFKITPTVAQRGFGYPFVEIRFDVVKDSWEAGVW